MEPFYEAAKVMVDGELFSMAARVYISGPRANLMTHAGNGKWTTQAKMRVIKAKELGENVSLFGTVDGKTVPQTWVITPNPCRSCS